MDGTIISVEGIDGAGKTTLVAGLAEWLESLGYSVKCLKEPGSTELGDYLRDVLLGGSKMGIEVTPRARLLLYLASMVNTQELEIKEGGYDYYLLDRWSLSTIAYQSLFIPEGEVINTTLMAGILPPHYTVLIDVQPLVGLERTIPDDATGHAPSRVIEILDGVRKNYLDVAIHHKDDIGIVDGSGSAEDTLTEAKSLLGEALGIGP